MNELLEKTKQILDICKKENIHTWLYGGALLGWYRDGSLIYWDKDIDLHIWKDDYDKLVKLRKQFEKLGCKYIRKEHTFVLKFSWFEIGFQYYIRCKEWNKAIAPNRLITKSKFDNVVYFSLFSLASEYRLKRTKKFLHWLLINCGSCENVTQVVPLKYFEELQEIDLFGVKVNVPLDIEGFFSYTLGEDWKIPLKPKEFKRPRKYYVYGGLTNGRNYLDEFDILKEKARV